MSEFVLTLRSPLPGRVDASPLVPDRLAGLSVTEVARVTLRFEGGDAAEVGEVFTVAGEVGPAVQLVGDLSRVDAIGHGMTAGTLAVEGSAGRRLGCRMSGGRIDVSGDCGDSTGREMTGGRIVVRGSVGRGTGGASPGSKRGMSGGEIVVFGDAGDEAGACLRRGLIAVAGNVGRDAAREAIAGTVVVGGDAGAPAGPWAKRASVVALGAIEVSPTYRYACTFRPPYVGLLLTYLRRVYGFPVSVEQAVGLFERYSGDMAETGAGEILRAVR